MKAVESRNYWFEIATWGMPGSGSGEAFLYNTDITTYSPKRRGGIRFEANTLYVLSHSYDGETKSTDTLLIALTDQQVDSLFDLAHNYLSSFEIDNKIEPGKIVEVINDGAFMKVSLGYRGKLFECSEFNLKGVSYSSEGGSQLISWINSKSPEKFHLY